LISKPSSFTYYLTTEIKNGSIIVQTRNNALSDLTCGFKFMMAKILTSIRYPEIVYFKEEISQNKFQEEFKRFIGFIKKDWLLVTLTNK
jgi:hypothetical protein